mmetsp:Transcript_17448/g.60935  ORF Transcript_17448/g.60935 Transcript_17448/m.60935 type:complete len:312 (-) Transcript_17448:75-1010(-)
MAGKNQDQFMARQAKGARKELLKLTDERPDRTFSILDFARNMGNGSGKRKAEGEWFHYTMQRLSEVPKKWWEALLVEVFQDAGRGFFNKGFVDRLNKADRATTMKIAQDVFGVVTPWKLPKGCLNKPFFAAVLKARSGDANMGQRIVRIEFLPDDTVDWSKSGPWSLLLVCPPSVTAHTYKEVGHITAGLATLNEDYNFNLTWKIDEMHSDLGAGFKERGHFSGFQADFSERAFAHLQETFLHTLAKALSETDAWKDILQKAVKKCAGGGAVVPPAVEGSAEGEGGLDDEDGSGGEEPPELEEPLANPPPM